MSYIQPNHLVRLLNSKGGTLNGFLEASFSASEQSIKQEWMNGGALRYSSGPYDRYENIQ